MKYSYSIIYNGKLYRAGEEVPVVINEKPESETGTAEVKNPEVPVNEDTKAEKPDTDTDTGEVKKTSKRRIKA